MRIGDFEKLSFFESAILIYFFSILFFNFFLLHPHKNQSKLLGYQGWVEILMITLVYSKRVSVCNNLLHSVCHPYNASKEAFWPQEFLNFICYGLPSPGYRLVRIEHSDFLKKTHNISKILFNFGSSEYLSRQESKIRKCLLFDGSIL